MNLFEKLLISFTIPKWLLEWLLLPNQSNRFWNKLRFYCQQISHFGIKIKINSQIRPQSSIKLINAVSNKTAIELIWFQLLPQLLIKLMFWFCFQFQPHWFHFMKWNSINIRMKTANLASNENKKPKLKVKLTWLAWIWLVQCLFLSNQSKESKFNTICFCWLLY